MGKIDKALRKQAIRAAKKKQKMKSAKRLKLNEPPTKDFDVDIDKTDNPLGCSRGGDSASCNLDIDRHDYGGLGNLSKNSPEYYNNYCGLSSRVFVANLDCKVVTTQKLEEVFKLAGRVVKIDLERDEEGNIKGYGTIEMGHPAEAVQAISMFNGQKFYNRTMNVRMDKKHKDDPEDKHLPEGLQSVGKGLGANGQPLHLSSEFNLGNTLISNNLAPAGLGAIGDLNAGGLGLMSNQMAPGVVGASPTGIGMGIQVRNFSTLGTGVGATGSAGFGNSIFLPGVFIENFNTFGAGGLPLEANAIGGSARLRYNDYDRSCDSGEDGYRNSRTSNVMYKNYKSVATETDFIANDKCVGTEDGTKDNNIDIECNICNILAEDLKDIIKERDILKSENEECKKSASLANWKYERIKADSEADTVYFMKLKKKYEELKEKYEELKYPNRKSETEALIDQSISKFVEIKPGNKIDDQKLQEESESLRLGSDMSNEVTVASNEVV